MSRHQAVRNLDYKAELDEFDGYSEEEDELTPEDRAAMTQGTIDVRATLVLLDPISPRPRLRRLSGRRVRESLFVTLC